MGRLIYGERSSYEIDDRVLAHLRIVVMNKLRRNEAFMLQLPPDASGHRSLWIHASQPLVMQFFGSRQPQVDTEVIAQMMSAANGPDGLTLRSRG